MLAKKYRLPIQTAMRMKGRARYMPLCTVKAFPPVFPYSRFGVLVTKKIAASAVRRNAVRRMIMAALEKTRAAWPIGDYLIIAHQAACAATPQQLYEECVPFHID